MAIRSWVPLGKVRSRRISTCQEPLGVKCACPCGTVKVLLCPSIENVSDRARLLPSRSVMPLPLLEVSVPLTENESPAAGLSVIGSTVRMVGDLTVMVVMAVVVECRVDEPLKNSVMAISPSG